MTRYGKGDRVSFGGATGEVIAAYPCGCAGQST